MRARELRIENVGLREDDRGARVFARVGGEEVFFACEGVSLSAAAEAFGSAFLLPAALRGARIVLEDPVDARWLDGMHELAALASAWWGCPARPLEACERPPTGTAAASGIGLCFTGGVDSFDSLLRRDPVVDHLVFVRGYDVELGDAARALAFERSLDAVAEAVMATPVVVRTNLRQHAWIRNAPWHRVFGGALAAAGHVLGESIGRLLIASSYPTNHLVPYGSHPRLDPCHASTRLAVDHHASSGWRFEKLRVIADDPLARAHLRVCWENRSSEGNCSRCEKCLRTMLTLEAVGRREAFPTFDRETPLTELLDALPRVENDVIRAYEVELGLGLTPELSRAVRDLIERSRAPRERRRWWRRARRG